MSDEEKQDGGPEQLGGLIGENLGKLIFLGILQTRAIMALSNALENDQTVSASTREIARRTMSSTDDMIRQIEGLTKGIDLQGIFDRGRT
ncbi:hypothetical protein HNP29_000457 [Pseudomonas alcaligenes]|nr:hypothetical protein [Pseudomonas alcaligenes]